MADLDSLFLGDVYFDGDEVYYIDAAVKYVSNDPPGDPAEPFAPGEPQTAPYFYDYRPKATRRPMPKGEAALVYDLTVKLKRGESAVRTMRLGESSFWKGRPDPVTALEALEGAEDTEAVLRRRRNLEFEAQEQYGWSDGLAGDEPPGGTYPPFTVGYAEDHWKEGFFKIPNLPGRFDIAVETGERFFEPFDTSDTTNFKVTSEPLYTADEVDNLKLQGGKQTYLLLVPQWWKFTITFDAYVVFRWASPDHRIGRQKFFGWPTAPGLALDGSGAGLLESDRYYYCFSWVTATAETKGGDSANILITDRDVDGKVRITDIPVGPEGTTQRKIYRSLAGVTPNDEFRHEFFLVATINNNDFGEEFVDNVPDASLGDPAFSEYPFPFGNSKENDFFFTPDGDNFNLEIGGDPPELIDPGFYWCHNEPGETWDDWTFCAADEVTPPSSACFDYDRIRSRLAQAERSCTIEGYKKALTRPVFPDETPEYSETSFTPAFPKLGTLYNDGEVWMGSGFLSGIAFETEDVFEEDTPATLEADDLESVVITQELADAEARRALCLWAENCDAYNQYFSEGQYDQDIGFGDSDTLVDAINSVDPSYGDGSDPDAAFDFVSLEGFKHWYSANGKLKVERAETPAGSLVGAIQLKRGDNYQRYFIWRKTASTGRAGTIVENVPFDSQSRFAYESLSGEDFIPRKVIRSDSSDPPGIANLDYDL